MPLILRPKIDSPKSIKQSLTFISMFLCQCREIQNCDSDLAEGEWFSHVLKIKKKLKKAEENAKKKGAQKPVLAKKPSTHIDFPPQLFEGIYQQIQAFDFLKTKLSDSCLKIL